MHLEEAIRMASTNPAKLYDLKDRGLIETGRRADLILFRVNEDEMIIEKTWVNGTLVFDRSKAGEKNN